MEDDNLTSEEDKAYRHLSGRAFASLDEHGETDLVKRMKSVENRLAKLGISESDTRRNAVKRFLIAFSDCETSYREAAKRCGIGLSDLHAEFEMWPEGKMVKDYIMGVKLELTRVQDIEDLKAARETMRLVMADAKSGGDSKAAMFMMSKLDRKRFGEDDVAGMSDGGSGRAQVVYNLPGLTLNMINAPKDMTLRLEKEIARPVINV